MNCIFKFFIIHLNTFAGIKEPLPTASSLKFFLILPDMLRFYIAVLSENIPFVIFPPNTNPY